VSALHHPPFHFVFFRCFNPLNCLFQPAPGSQDRKHDSGWESY
jgi:hypothetical protein